MKKIADAKAKFGTKDRFGLLLVLGIAAGTAAGIAIKNIPAATSMGMILGLISGLCTKIISKPNDYHEQDL